jgi:hypothetical protein
VVTTKLDDISEAIGSLRAEVRNLGQKIDRAEMHAADSNRLADEHRATISRRVDEVGDVKTNVATMRSDITAGIGGTAIGGSVVGFVVYWWDAIMRLLPPPDHVPTIAL